MKLKWTIILFFIPAISFSQRNDTVLITPGHKLLQSAKLKDYTAKYDFMSYKDGAEAKIGGLEEHFIVLTDGKKKQGLRICNITFGTNKILDSGLCLLKGLRPIYHRSIQTKKRMSLDFENELVSGRIDNIGNALDTSEAVYYIAPLPLFDSYYEDMIAKTIKLRDGLLFKFPEYIYERGGTVWSSGEAVLTERKINGGRTWKVIFYEKNPEGKIIRTTTYLMNEDSREIISREYKTETNRIVMQPVNQSKG